MAEANVEIIVSAVLWTYPVSRHSLEGQAVARYGDRAVPEHPPRHLEGFMTIQATLNRSQLKWDTYMFLGNQYLSYRLTDNTIRVGPRTIVAGWPGLADTQFADAIDAMVPFSYPPVLSTVPVLQPEKEYVYVFKGDQYLRYDFANDQIIYGPLDIGQWWPGMKD